MTDALFWGTNHFIGEPNNLASSVESYWNNDFDDPPSITIDSDEDLPGFDSDDYKECGELLESLEDNPWIQNELDNYDAVLVIDDNPDTADCGGIANVASAGGDQAVGWVRTGTVDTTMHELGHIHGCSHEPNGTEDWERMDDDDYSIMCTDDCPSEHTDCNWQSPSSIRRSFYLDCEEEALCDTVWSNYCDD